MMTFQCSAMLTVFVAFLLFSKVLSIGSRNDDITRGQRLPDKLLTIIRSLDDRSDANVLDYVLETNRGLGLNLFEGDIHGFNPRHRNAIRFRDALWPARTVPYVMDPSLEPAVRSYIEDAIHEFHVNTCLRWVARTDQADYVVFIKKTGCYSSVGRAGGAQELSLMGPCARKGTAMHEMLHVLGFFHEHSRPDRDDWVTIMLQNVKAGKESNFDRLPVDMVNSLGVQYDYGSIMHYSRTAFSANGQPTILPKRDPFAILGQRQGFSPRDVEKPTSSPVTQPTVATRPPVGWTAWSAWSDCDMQCRHFRYRYCLNPDRHYCPGDSQETQVCPPPCQVAVSLGCWASQPSSQPPSQPSSQPAGLPIPSVEGQYAAVNDSYRLRTAAVRKCADVASALGTDVFGLLDGGECLTGRGAVSTFNTYGPSSLCPPSGKGGASAINVYSFSTDMDGGWGLWTAWGQCTRSCGGGRKYRYRKCDSPPPIGQGAPCQGRDEEVTDCNTVDCQVASDCGVKHHVGSPGTSGYINVLHYANYMSCEYVIQSGQRDVTISLAVTRMDIEYSAGCMYDALTLYDGYNDTSGQFLGAYCGRGPLVSVQSSGPALYVRFSSDSTTTATGFTISFAVNDKQRKACTRPLTPFHGYAKGSNYVGDTVVFSCDPGYHLFGQASLGCVDQPGMATWTDQFPLCLSHRRRRAVSQMAVAPSCSFEGNACGFYHDEQQTWRWAVTRGNDSAAFHQECPLTDRRGSSEGHFLYVESNPSWRPYDAVRVTSRRYEVGGSDPQCLVFWYRFYGNDLVSFNVLQLGSEGKDSRTVWSIKGETAATWRQAKVPLGPQPFVQVAFQASLGQQLISSVAIDDVLITRGRC